MKDDKKETGEELLDIDEKGRHPIENENEEKRQNLIRSTNIL